MSTGRRRTDVYSTGLLLIQLLTGVLPFSGETWIEYEQLHIDAPRPPPSSTGAVPPALDHVILRSLEPNPNDRYESILEFSKAATDAARDSSPTPQKNLAIHLEINFDGEDPSDADLDAADEVLIRASRKLRGPGMSVVSRVGRVAACDGADARDASCPCKSTARTALDGHRVRPQAQRPSTAVGLTARDYRRRERGRFPR